MSEGERDNEVGQFRKKPVAINAVRIKQRFLWPDWFHDAVSRGEVITHGIGKFGSGPVYVEIKTLEGVMIGREGDWIIQGVSGELYPCKHEIFQATYEAAD